jgi:hypothetical protein
MKLHTALTKAFLGLCIGVGLFAQAPPPERAEITAARRLADGPEKIKEFLRIKAAYPNSEFKDLINLMLFEAECKGADSYEKLIAVQRKFIDSAKPEERFSMLDNGAIFLVGHANAAKFPAANVLKTVQAYKAMALKLLDDPAANANIPKDVLESKIDLPLAKAFLLNGESKPALGALEDYKKTGMLSAAYHRTMAEALLDQKRDKDALEAFISAHVEGDADAKERARGLYVKVNKSETGFEATLEQRLAELPFHPEAFVAPAEWKGKAALAELFTGSECPPCVGADFAFDGLIDAYPTQYLAILEYHLPIPRPDPMMNPATNQRGNFYGIRSTPTVVIDGKVLTPGGGGRAAAKPLYEGYKSQIDPSISSDPAITISAKATLTGENLLVDCEFSQIIEGTQYNVAVVQTEEKYKGSNGIIFHKMVVRDVQTLSATDKASVAFDIAESEKATDDYLTEFEKTSTRFRDFKFPVRHHKIDRAKLKAVVFVQDTETKQVNNAVVVDVAIKD